MPAAIPPDDALLQRILAEARRRIADDALLQSAAAYWSIAALNFAEEDWQKIWRSCKAVDVDADSITVRIRGLPGEWLPLRQAVPLIAQGCDYTSRLQQQVLTPRELAKEQSHIIDLCSALRTRLDGPKNYNRFDPATHHLQFHPRIYKLAWRVQAALEEFVAELERCRNELTTMGSDRGKGNSTAHNQFWKELTHIWDAHVNKDKQTAKYLAKFLLACSVPFFPEETTYGAVDAFVEREIASRKQE
jgi:hypothetical protein